MRQTVLLVDDEPDILLAARLLLEDAGYAVIEASGGQDALDLMGKTKLDAVFLDLRMPGVDGWDVLEELRGRSTVTRLPVIVLSAHADPSAVERSVALGARGYVRKPFRAADLTRALRTVLQGAPRPTR
ncbi:MAG TPA: response regulator [Thermoleophilaceae bacterium]